MGAIVAAIHITLYNIMKELLMEPESIARFIELGGTVVVVAMFIWYLKVKNGKQEKAMQNVADTLREVDQSLARNTKVLIRVAGKHGLNEDADDLMKL